MAVGNTFVFPGFLTPALTQLSFQSHQLLFSHALEVRVKNKPERNFASTGYQTQNHQVMSQTRSPLSHPGGTMICKKLVLSIYKKYPPMSTANMHADLG